jgi:transposase-like protein
MFEGGFFMSKVPKKRTSEFKLKLALEALKGEKTIVQIASEHGIHPKQIQRWRDQLLEEGQDLFIHKTIQKKADPDKEKLLHIIAQLTLELEFLKKKLKRND